MAPALKAALDAKGMTARQLAIALRCSEGHARRILAGRMCGVSHRLWRRAAEVLGIRMEVFVTTEGEAPPVRSRKAAAGCRPAAARERTATLPQT